MEQAVYWNYRKQFKCYRENKNQRVKKELKNLKSKTLFKAFNEDKDTAEIYLHGPIRDPLPDETEEDTINLKDVRKKLNEITADKIICHINSTGGDLFQSVAIHNLLVAKDADIIGINDGVAASGGSIILVAADTIKFYRNSSMMIHAAHTITYGDAEDHREVARKLDKLDKSLKENYADRFTGTDKELTEMLKTDTWLTAKEAKEYGFCDVIINGESEEGKEVENLMSRFAASGGSVKDKLMQKYGNKSGSKNKNLLNKLNGGQK